MTPHENTPKIPDAISRRRIAAHAPVTERRVLRAYRDPLSVQPCTLARVTRAALELGIAPPLPTAVAAKPD